MKKILALMMALCMALAAVPALAESEVAGSWYLISMGMTAASIELNENGTCVITATNKGVEEKREGTWTQDGETVTLTVDDQGLPLTYNGTDLVLGNEAVALLGGDDMAAAISGGIDLTALEGLMKISREPAAITVAEFDAFQSDGTLPEGKTQEEMEKIQQEVQMLAISLFAGMMGGNGGEITGIGDTGVTAEAPELTISDENFYVRESYFGQEAVYLAKVENKTEAPFWINDGTCAIKDADGNEIAKREYLGTCGSRYLEPGEVSFVSFVVDLQEGTTAASYDVDIKTSASGFSKDQAVDVGNVELRTKEGFSGTDYYTAVSVTNAGEEPVAYLNVVVMTKDSEGKMLDVSDSSLGMNELAAGSTVILVDDIPSAVAKYCDANGLTLGEMEAYAWVENY